MSSTSIATRPSAALRVVQDRITHVRSAMRVYGRRYATYQQTVRELSACTDRELADMGISRFDVRRLAREAAALAR